MIPTVKHAYRDRAITPEGILQLAGYQMKSYAITVDGKPPRRESFALALDLAARHLPQPPLAPGRFGVGFVISHRGRGEDYLVLNWWDKENELFNRVFTAVNDGDDWRLATGGNVACVWDLLVIGFERDAFVSTVLAREGERDVNPYLNRMMPPRGDRGRGAPCIA